ncbi:MAG TPA: AMP-binding protein [Acidimicrobiales bacterium]|nr:AMP-binding protein [Acidimicrobiales bacterium]
MVAIPGPSPDRDRLRPPALVGEVLAPALAAGPDREAVVTRAGRWTYRGLDTLAAAAAGALAELGVRAGDRVAAALPNEIDVVVAFHGAMRLGAIWVGVNRALAPPEKSYILSDSGSSLLLCDAATAEQLNPMVAGLPDLRRTVVISPGEATGDWPAALSAHQGAAGSPGSDGGRAHDPDAPAALAYTSGTTGHPKGAVHSQRGLLLPGAVLTATRGYGPELRKGDCLPLTILNLLVLSTLLVAQAGGCTVVMDRIDAGGVAEWIERERVTTWNGPPALLYSLVHDDSIRPEALASLEDVWVGGADCPEHLRAAFAEKFGVRVNGTYGLTEAPTVVTIDRLVPATAPDPHRPGASGIPLPHLDVRIEGEDGSALPAGETGEICLAPATSGPWAGAYRPPAGYWQRPDASAELLRGGVVHTGDVGYVDADGYLAVRDRRNQTILRGGANVYPAEVERVLSALPGVAACAVFGIPDERLGQRVVAAVEPVPGAALAAEELGAACAAELARYKVPERFAFVERFGRNSMGKIDRRRLGALFAAEPLP